MSSHDMTGRSLSWSEIPTALLRAELERRQDGATKPTCGSGKQGSYNTPVHVFALGLILFLSTAACGFPLVSKRASKSAGPNQLVFFSQHFGTGVLIATAFVHLLPTAFVNLTDPCLGGVWDWYKPMAGLIAMSSVLIVVSIEMFLRTRGAGHSHSHGEAWNPVATEEDEDTHHHNGSNGNSVPKRTYRKERLGAGHRPSDIALEDMESERLVENVSPYPLAIPTPNENGSRFHEDMGEEDDEDKESDLDLEELDPSSHVQNNPGNAASEEMSAKEEQKKLLVQCLLLEAGILFHSIFIGMAISVATGTPFIIFLIAISFHQTFEGFALGSRIANINFPKSSPRPWLMVLAYGMTTPIGQAIGLLVHNMYDPMSETGLLMVGIMNAISSGLLLFAGLVQLLAEDFLTDKSYTVLNGKRRLHAYCAVVSGSTLMAIVGAWA